MAAEPARRPEPRKFLDASLTPLERALRARADTIEAEADGLAAIGNRERDWIGYTASEFRALADELHHW